MTTTIMTRRRASRIAALALLGMTSALGAPRADAVAAPASAPAPVPRPAERDTALWIEMRNVDLHIDRRHVMHVRSLRGQMLATVPGGTMSLDDPRSFHIRATSGVVALDGDAITTLLNANAFNYRGAPITHLRVRVENGAIVQQGTLHKGVDIPFEMRAVPVVLPDGRLLLHPSLLRIFSVNGLPLMHALHLRLDEMMDLRKAHGVSVKGNDLFLDPLAIIPPPAVQGRVVAVRVEGGLLVQELARTPDDTIFGTRVRADSGARNFVYFRGGTLRFGKLTMTDTDLLIDDADEHDPLDLYFAEYNRQLVAGETKNLPDFGLRTWMVDYDKLRTVATAKR